ncbi:MAG TPA: phosphoenolpyruvate--protein phosphotransferase, partial [bacterium]|nr:phosphoenolpyruvate--protein phosphotransferase [bacterium]
IPSAVMMANEMAKEVDFFSIGTNDLVQYSLAIDRINEHVSHLYNPFHPAVLRMIHRTVRAAKKAGIPVSLCGELAGDPLAISLMVGMELDSLSMNPISIPRVKKILRSISKSQLEKLVPKILTLSTGDEVLKYLKRRTSGILPGEVKKLHIVGS